MAKIRRRSATGPGRTEHAGGMQARWTRRILVLNAGSSSIKFSLFAETGTPAPELVLRGKVEGLNARAKFAAIDSSGAQIGSKEWGDGESLDHDGAIVFLLDWLQRHAQRRVSAVGHRVVHGGTQFSAPVAVDPDFVAQLDKLVPLAPLHQPHSLALIKICCRVVPACRRSPASTRRFIAPSRRSRRPSLCPPSTPIAGVRRYGFHGLSYEYIASALPQFDARAAAGRTVVLHLGNGASMCAMRGGRSIATTMGFTPLDGLPMGTRSGAIDPGVLLYLIDEHRMDARALEDLLYRQSGLLGVSGLSGDMRTLEASSEPGAKAGNRSVRLPHRARARFLGGGARRARCHRVHRWHRREQHSDSGARMPRRALARDRSRCRSKSGGRTAHQLRLTAASRRGLFRPMKS